MRVTPSHRPLQRPRVAASRRVHRRRAFTLIELIAVLVIIGLLAGLAIPPISDSIDRARVARAIGDIRAIAQDLAVLDSVPDALADIGRGDMRDPWGRPYVFYKFPPPPGPSGGSGGGGSGGGPGGGGSGGGPGGGGGGGGGGGSPPPAGARKDRFLVPINSRYDLYSRGPDGDSRPPLTALPSRDDIVMANDGGFIGLAAKF
jgi:general secretion pathway protein G